MREILIRREPTFPGMRVALLATAVLVAGALAGCTTTGTASSTSYGELTNVGGDTGGIRGVVLDERIVPIVGALVSLTKEKTTKTDANGQFNFTGLKEGDYLLKISKLGYESGQTSTHVTAGVRDPSVVKIQIALIPGFKASRDVYKLDGFYECGFSFGQPGNPVITDQCDMGVRTAYDYLNGTVPGYPLPRNVMSGQNTQFIDLASDVLTIVQQTFWEDGNVPTMMTTLSSTPISNDCDCSDHDYMFAYLKPAEVNRIDKSKNDTYQGSWPAGERVAARGFLNWESVSTAQNLKFEVITVVFHNYEAQPGFDFTKIDQYPVPK
jgi:hypothetical protein